MLCAVKFQSTMFKVGQKVVCIKADDFGYLQKDEVYEIRGFCYNGQGIHLIGIHPTQNLDNGFWIDRFRPIDDSWVEELLCKLMSEAEVDELVSA